MKSHIAVMIVFLSIPAMAAVEAPKSKPATPPALNYQEIPLKFEQSWSRYQVPLDSASKLVITFDKKMVDDCIKQAQENARMCIMSIPIPVIRFSTKDGKTTVSMIRTVPAQIAPISGTPSKK